jgi:hypothetical protein
VSILFYRSLRSHADEIHPPTEVIAALHDDSLFASAYSMRHQHELSRVLQTLQNAGLPVIILKGAYLAEQVFEQPGKRLMSDLDLLIQYKDLQPTVTALETLGYRPPVPISVRFETRVAQHLQPLIKRGALPIEIHWTLAVPGSPQQFDIPGLWLRAVPVKIAQAEALALAPEDLLLHLCYHTAYQHTFGYGLRGLTDIAYVMRRFAATFDWDEITRRARAAILAAPVYLAVRLAVELLGAPVPPLALETLRPVGFDDQAVLIGKELLFADQNIINTITPDLALSANNPPFFSGSKLFGGVYSYREIPWQGFTLPNQIHPRYTFITYFGSEIYGCVIGTWVGGFYATTQT